MYFHNFEGKANKVPKLFCPPYSKPPWLSLHETQGETTLTNITRSRFFKNKKLVRSYI